MRERQPSSGEKIALFFFLSVTHKIESCFKFEFEIRSVKMSVEISWKKNDDFDG